MYVDNRKESVSQFTQDRSKAKMRGEIKISLKRAHCGC